MFFFENYTDCDVNIQISYIYIFKIEIRNIKICSFEMSVSSTMVMGQWTNSNICRTVTDGPFLRANISKCSLILKRKSILDHRLIDVVLDLYM